jgi:hypothetical protein
MSTQPLTQHAERAHALLSPSSASRWIACTPSARLEDQYPDKRSDAADEGTLAHELAEVRLRKELGLLKPGAFKKRMAEISTSKWYSQEMETYIDGYVTYVLERYAEAKARTKDAVIMLEVKLDLTRWIPEAFGTGDVVIVSEGNFEMIDLKYGKGVPVSAEGNAQLRVYGLGALERLLDLYGIDDATDEVRMTIYQPRLDNVSTEVLTVQDLGWWGVKVLQQAAIKAHKGEGELVPGKHCRFCRHAGVCKALADKNLEIARHEFKSPTHLTPEEVSDILFRSEDFTSWINAVKEHALDAAVKRRRQVARLQTGRRAGATASTRTRTPSPTCSITERHRPRHRSQAHNAQRRDRHGESAGQDRLPAPRRPLHRQAARSAHAGARHRQAPRARQHRSRGGCRVRRLIFSPRKYD